MNKEEKRHAKWCRDLVDSMQVGQPWTIPRASLTFVKVNKNRICLLGQLSALPSLQRKELDTLSFYMEKAGITVAVIGEDADPEAFLERMEEVGVGVVMMSKQTGH